MCNIHWTFSVLSPFPVNQQLEQAYSGLFISIYSVRHVHKRACNMLNAALHAQPFFAGLVWNMNINSYKATEKMEALTTFLLTATIIK